MQPLDSYQSSQSSWHQTNLYFQLRKIFKNKEMLIQLLVRRVSENEWVTSRGEWVVCPTKTRLAICVYVSQVEKGSWFSVDFNKTTFHFWALSLTKSASCKVLQAWSGLPLHPTSISSGSVPQLSSFYAHKKAKRHTGLVSWQHSLDTSFPPIGFSKQREARWECGNNTTQGDRIIPN